MTVKVTKYKESEKLSQTEGDWGNALDWVLNQNKSINGKIVEIQIM